MSKFTAIVHKEDELYVAQCPDVGTASQGKTIEEAVTNLQETTELYLDEFPMYASPNLGLLRFRADALGVTWTFKAGRITCQQLPHQY